MDTPPPISIPALAADVFRGFRQCWRPALGYALLFKLLTIALIAPLAAFWLASLLAWSGHVAISNTQIATFLQTPAGVAALASIGTLGMLSLLLEQAGLMWLANRFQSGAPTARSPQFAVWRTALSMCFGSRWP